MEKNGKKCERVRSSKDQIELLRLKLMEPLMHWYTLLEPAAAIDASSS